MKQSTTARLSAAAILAAAFCSAPAANAAPSGPPDPLVVDLEAGTGCSFALSVRGVDSNRHTKNFLDANGKIVRTIDAGKGFTLTFTNAENGKSITFKGNGSVTHTTIDNATGISTVTATGHNGLVLFPTDIPAGPTTTVYTGRIVYTVDAAGVFTLKSTSGTKVDVCAALK
ncbi:hypothetical protein [Pseudarthrobacter sp. H2]|uniref:hypothetical protein n=1 Tax=Pseudarthrobacter sp. H2 TaxID=3418415 RepID=UPI003CFA9708